MRYSTTKLLINLVFKFVVGVLAWQLATYLMTKFTPVNFVAVWFALEVGLKSAVTFRE